jgi:beta-galactosidase
MHACLLKIRLEICMVLVMICSSLALAQTPFVPVPQKLDEQNGKFFLNGKPFQVIAGEMHYPRIPRELWRDRIKRAKAMGINTISAYVFWAFHEKKPGEFDFSGNADIAEFVRIAHSEGMFVWLRPGPYVCAEYDFGGYPYWLLNIPNLKWRSDDPVFMSLMQRYIHALGEQLKPLQITKGGPILFVQVENEYGSYASDKVYMGKIRDMMVNAGFDVKLTTCDGAQQMKNGYVSGCLPTINGSIGEDIFRTIDLYQPGGPYLVAEFYPAWFDNWGFPHSSKDKDIAAKQFDWMLSKGVGVSIYMLHGGTNFWYTNGANYPSYKPQPTSYDYDAPIGEYGNLTPKFYKMREVAAKYQYENKQLPQAPAEPKITLISEFKLKKSAPLSAAFKAPVQAENPMSMEALNQDYGYILYRTTINERVDGPLICNELRDFAVVMLDGKPVGQMDRRHDQNQINLKITKVPATLDILVENGGRINYGVDLLNNNKGITQSVTLKGKVLKGWEHYSLPLHESNVFQYAYGKEETGHPAFHYGQFEVNEENPGEVFLDLSKWGKGSVWVNGHSLGKFWSIGPQQTLYLPSCWVKKGKNEIVVFELDDRGARTIKGLAKPELAKLQKDPNQILKTRPGKDPELKEEDQVAAVELLPKRDVQNVEFVKPLTARHVAIEITSTHKNSPVAALSEIEIVDEGGNSVPRSNLNIWSVSSEEMKPEPNLAELIIDGDLTTVWQTAQKQNPAKSSHVIVVDLGSIQTIRGLKVYQRQDRGPGVISGMRVYARPQFFLSRSN